MRYKRIQRNTLLLAVMMFGVMMFFGSAHAMRFQPGSDTTIDVDVTVNYGAGIRVSDDDKDLLADINGDDARLNFEQWDMINNKLSINADIDIQYKDLGIFVRPKAFYDLVYMTDNSNPSSNNTAATSTNNALVGGLINNSDEWNDEVESVHGANATILDFFGYATFDLGERMLQLRVGRQTIMWGESLFISTGISGAQSHLDVAAATAAGTETKEIFLPTEAVLVQMDLNQSTELKAYYQWKWEHTILFEGGSFFAGNDWLDNAGAPLLAAPGTVALPRGPAQDQDARDGGQYGVAVKHVAEWLGASELGLYYLNYHNKGPEVNIGVPVFISYTEDIKLYGASVGTQVGSTSITGEFSYREGLNEGTENYWQAQSAWMWVGPFPMCDRGLFWGEVGCGREIGTADDTFAWRYVTRLYMDYYQVCQDLDLTLELVYEGYPSGTNAIGTEGKETARIGVSGTYKTVYRGNISYQNRFNAERNSDADKDTVTLSLSYSF